MIGRVDSTLIAWDDGDNNKLKYKGQLKKNVGKCKSSGLRTGERADC